MRYKARHIACHEPTEWKETNQVPTQLTRHFDVNKSGCVATGLIVVRPTKALYSAFSNVVPFVSPHQRLISTFERKIDAIICCGLDQWSTVAQSHLQFYPDGLSTPTLCVCGHTTNAVALLPGLDASIQTIKAELSDLKTIKTELSDIKSSLDFVDHKIGALSDRITDMEKDIQSLQKTKNEVEFLQVRVQNLEGQLKDNEQRSRLNNIEVKGVPVSNSENLFDIISKIETHVKCSLPREQINYIARVPMRNGKHNKSIVIAVHSRYIKDNFVAAAKKCTTTAADLGLQGTNRVFVNDHLTLENKILLNKTKTLAKDRGFAFTWVKGCRIFVRKNPTSPVIGIRSESDLKKL